MAVGFGVFLLVVGGLAWWVRRHALGQASAKQRARERFDREREADRLACREAEQSIVRGPGGYDASSAPPPAAGPGRGSRPNRSHAAAERWKAANPASPFDEDLPVP